MIHFGHFMILGMISCATSIDTIIWSFSKYQRLQFFDWSFIIYFPLQTLVFISKWNVEPPELRLVGDLREYNLSKLGLITLSLLPAKEIMESKPTCMFLWTDCTEQREFLIAYILTVEGTLLFTETYYVQTLFHSINSKL